MGIRGVFENYIIFNRQLKNLGFGLKFYSDGQLVHFLLELLLKQRIDGLIMR